MTKLEIASKISDKSGVEKVEVMATIDAFMSEIKEALENNNNSIRSF